MANTKKIYTQGKTGTSASNTYVVVDDGSEELKSKPIEEVGGGGATFERVEVDMTTGDYTYSATKTFAKLKIQVTDSHTLNITTTSANVGDHIYIMVDSGDLGDEVIFGTGIDGDGRTKIIAGGQAIFVFDGTNFLLVSK